jgi:hypothetical protein
MHASPHGCLQATGRCRMQRLVAASRSAPASLALPLSLAAPAVIPPPLPAAHAQRVRLRSGAPSMLAAASHGPKQCLSPLLLQHCPTHPCLASFARRPVGRAVSRKGVKSSHWLVPQKTGCVRGFCTAQSLSDSRTKLAAPELLH